MSIRPTVVLLGWLGCHPRNLRRFINLYDRMGWDTIVRIASPESVIAATERGLLHQNMAANESGALSEMNRLARDTLCDIQTRRKSQFIVHIFSNGGCFLWEWFRHILFSPPSLLVPLQNSDRNNFQQKLVGLIFDSAPCYYGEKVNSLESALQYITPVSERERMLEIASKLNSSFIEQRHNEFWEGMYHDRIDIPHLYFYSEADHLTSHKHLEQIINNKRILLSNEKVWSHNFIDSEHCCHILKYPDMYESITKKFLNYCTVDTGHSLEFPESADCKRSKL